MTRPVVLFDWDGTLVDNWPVIHEALALTLEAHGQPAWTFAETVRRLSGPSGDRFRELFGAEAEAARQTFHDAFAARHLDALTLLPGAEACLDRLEAAGFQPAVVSNKTGVFLRREAARLGWTERFAALVGAGDAARDKPDAAPVRLALAGREGRWLVGDTDTDILAARRAGLRVALVPFPGGARPGLRPDARCDSLAAVPDLVTYSHRLIYK